MRYLIVLLALLSGAADAPRCAAAEQGYRAKFTSTITISGEFDKLLQASSANSHDNSSKMPTAPSSMTIEPMVGCLYFTSSIFRVDYLLPQSGIVLTIIVDSNSKKYYLVNHSRREAYVIDFASLSEMDKQIGLPVSYPDQMFYRWQDVQRRLNAISSTKLKDLGTKKIEGELCHGLAYTADLADVFKADGYTPLESVPPITEIKGKWSGVFWLSERLGLPMLMDIDMLGVQCKWELSGLEGWQPIGALLRVPLGYVIRPLTASEMITALSLGQAKP